MNQDQSQNEDSILDKISHVQGPGGLDVIIVPVKQQERGNELKYQCGWICKGLAVVFGFWIVIMSLYLAGALSIRRKTNPTFDIFLLIFGIIFGLAVLFCLWFPFAYWITNKYRSTRVERFTNTF